MNSGRIQIHRCGLFECESRSCSELVVPAETGMVNLDVKPGALIIMTRSRMGTPKTASGLVYFLRVNEYGNES